MIRHAGLLALRLAGDWRGALIEGPSGSGKSDLALRALEAGWSLVADDRTLLWTSGGRLFGRAPDALGGLIEARGLGVLPQAGRSYAEISLIVRCTPPGAIERLPNDEAEDLLGIYVPLVRLAALEASAAAKLSRALTHLGVRS
ncbi:MAG TPA: HPr kinase/phosphatase C-terminal domain-containing protein [Caulobacteraceae bacterium]|jgi:serine kinase of HPr protein (carbohydrate metabolism regulator)|nr:HPr kinase/phosphatase C-terminal domain-containing protein [Caulobacteraceae bacterium]